AFGRTFLRLSEPGGYFASENVVSNELSYLHVLDASLEYLCTLLARPAPHDSDAWANRSITDIIGSLDKTPVSAELAKASGQEIARRVAAFGIPLDANDLMPVWRDLLVEVDRAGNHLNYLAADS